MTLRDTLSLALRNLGEAKLRTSLTTLGVSIGIQNQGGTPGNLFSLPLWLIGGAIGFSVTISLIAGSYPAARAARLDPIRALRLD